MLAGENQEMGENGRKPTKWVYKETRSHKVYLTILGYYALKS